MENIKTGKEKQEVYTKEYQRLSRALKEGFYLEAIFISYAIVEDRFIAFLNHAGIVSRQKGKLAINREILPFIRKLLGKKESDAVRIKDISIKMEIVQKLIQLTEEEAALIDEKVKKTAEAKRILYLANKGYMTSLQKQVAYTVDVSIVLDMFEKMNPWRDERNQLIHALLNKKMKSSEEARKECAVKGKELSRRIDDALVKPFKKNNRIRKQFNIQ